MKSKIKINNFLDIKKPEVAYILGLIWADGCVTFANNNAKTPQIKHQCVKSDSADFYPIFQKTGDWANFSFFNKKAIGQNEMLCNWVSCRELGEFLIEMDYRTDSDSPCKILATIPDDLKHYWYRGYFDGDGSISMKLDGHKSIAFSSNKNQDWKFITDKLHTLSIPNTHRLLKDKRGESSQIRFSKQNDIRKFGQFIYPKMKYDFGLIRKYEKFLALDEHLRTR